MSLWVGLWSPDGVGCGRNPQVCCVGSAGVGGVSVRKPYPSDLSDEQWSLIEPVITAWKDRHRSVSGHQGAYDMREIVNAIPYQGRTGCRWAYLPHDLPQKSATYYYCAAWRDDGTDQVIHELLRCQVRERARRSEDPTLAVLDTQSVHAAVGVPASTTGHDPAKVPAEPAPEAGKSWSMTRLWPAAGVDFQESCAASQLGQNRVRLRHSSASLCIEAFEQAGAAR